MWFTSKALRASICVVERLELRRMEDVENFVLGIANRSPFRPPVLLKAAEIITALLDRWSVLFLLNCVPFFIINIAFEVDLRTRTILQ